MAKTNTGLVEYVKAKIGCYYWFGTFGQMASRSLYNSKKAQYPKYYTAKDFAKQIADPKQVFDCSGLIKAYLWTDSIDDVTPKYNAKQDFGATAFYDNAKVKGALGSGTQLKVGTLVFKGTDKTKSHVGVFIGDNQVVEAKGHAYGVVLTTFSSGGWKYYAECNLITYEAEAQPAPSAPATPVQTTKYKVKTNGDVLYLRSEPNTQSAKLTSMPNGTELDVSEIVTGENIKGNADWAKTVYSGKSGYCSCKYLTVVTNISAPAESEPVYHTVKKGDTLSALARKYNTTVKKLVDLNHIKNPNMIVIGQKLRMK